MQVKISLMNNCLWYKNRLGCALEENACPYSCDCDASVKCSGYVYNDKTKTSAFDKIASWQDVSDKAHAIVNTGGVTIVRDDAQEVEAAVESIQLLDTFPVYWGGPYTVILSKKSWGNKGNVGGWLQGWLCDCEWGNYHDGEPGDGGRFSGRFCSHAYAALLASNMRARQDFMGDRAAMKQAYRPYSDRGWEDVPSEGLWMRDYYESDAFAVILLPNSKDNPSDSYILRFQLEDNGEYEEYYGDSLEELKALADEMNEEDFLWGVR